MSAREFYVVVELGGGFVSVIEGGFVSVIVGGFVSTTAGVRSVSVGCGGVDVT